MAAIHNDILVDGQLIPLHFQLFEDISSQNACKAEFELYNIEEYQVGIYHVLENFIVLELCLRGRHSLDFLGLLERFRRGFHFRDVLGQVPIVFKVLRDEAALLRVSQLNCCHDGIAVAGNLDLSVNDLFL